MVSLTASLHACVRVCVCARARFSSLTNLKPWVLLLMPPQVYTTHRVRMDMC
jgi:hypothetical protein